MTDSLGNLRVIMLSVLCMLSGPAMSESLSIEAVLDRTTIIPPSRVGFREVRHNQMLKDNLVMTGYLEYLEAGSLRKVVETPFEEAYLIRSDRIEIDRQGVTKTLSLRKSRTLRTMLSGVEAILAGKTEQLASVFDYELSGVEEDWSLQLLPRSKRMAKQVTSLTVTGDLESVTAIRFDLKNGEWHNMEMTQTSDSGL
jgi:hypothetical protein